MPTPRSPRWRVLKNRLFVALCIGAAAASVVILATLLITIGLEGSKYLRWEFLTTFPSRRPAEAGMKAAFWGSIWLCVICMVVALPVGVMTAVLLEEFKPTRRWLKVLHSFVQLNIGNLAGVPSIVYGIIGLTAFVNMFGLFGSPNLSLYDDAYRVRTISGQVIQGELLETTDAATIVMSPVHGRTEIPAADIKKAERIYIRHHNFELADGRRLAGAIKEADGSTVVLIDDDSKEDVAFPATSITAYWSSNVFQIGDENDFFYMRIPFGGSVLAGGLTLMLVILPVIIIASVEALRAVPSSLRQGALAIGATPWQVVQKITLPAAVPGIMTGAILAMSRAIGEAAPLLVAGGFLFIMFTPRNLMDDFAAMPLQIYNWAGRPQEEFHKVAATGIIVLLTVLLSFNAIAIVVRQKFQKPLQ
jgi:phosphate transport system permease protein